MFDKRGWRVCLALLAVALLAAACGSDEDDAVEAPSTTAAAPAPADDAPEPADDGAGDAAAPADDGAADDAPAPADDGADAAAPADDAAGDAAAEPEILWNVPANGNSDEWVTWDSTECAYVPAADHPDLWVPMPVSSNGELVVGFGAQDTVNEVNITMNASMDRAGSVADVVLAIADYQFPSTSEPISAAQSIVVREPAVVISNNQLDDVLDSVNEIYVEACIPVVQVVTASAGTVLFGPSNAGMGVLEGERLVAFAESQGWTAENTTLFTTFFSPAGPEVALRASVCADVVREAFPGIESVEHDTTSTTSLELQNNFTDMLTANPDAENILSCTVADLWALANAEALKVSGRHVNAAVTGVNGGSAVLDAITEGDTALVGSVDLGAALWGEYWIPLAQGIAAGRPVPAEVFAPIVMLPEELPTR